MMRYFKGEDIIKLLHQYKPDLSKQTNLFNTVLSQKPISISLIKELLTTYHLDPYDFIFSLLTSTATISQTKPIIDDILKDQKIASHITKWFFEKITSINCSLTYDFLKIYQHHIDFEYRENGHTFLEYLLLKKKVGFYPFIQSIKVDFSKHSQLLSIAIREGCTGTAEFITENSIKTMLPQSGFFKAEPKGSEVLPTENPRTKPNN